jgi:histidyl-tRNA synthetase
MEMLQTLKGFRDFLPREKRARDYIIEKIKETFEIFGFEPVETPTLEYAELLLGKYGEEADKLVYSFADRGERQVALRYDQTVPITRMLVQYQHELPRYFRRYQVQNVFRAEKPQRGRYREFTQADIDIFGSTSPIADAEILACTYFAYKNIGFLNVTLKINDRKTLFETLKPFATAEVDVFSIIQSIDKLDKQSREEVLAELSAKGLASTQARQALEAIQATKPTENLNQIIAAATGLGIPAEALEYAPALSRGLDYYTGMIFEVFIPEYPVGACGGGGRYDQLVEQLSGVDIPAVGFAFGFDRTVEAALELDLVPISVAVSQVLITVFDESTTMDSLRAAQKLRLAGVHCEVYPELERLGKQLKLANQKSIPFVVIIGPDEAKKRSATIRNMITGEQSTVEQADLAESIIAKLPKNGARV